MTNLTVSNVSHRFGGLQALRDVTFSIERGQLVAIIGPNGAGKSTLINVISGELPPTAGTVIFNGKMISGWPSHRISRAGLVRTFQSGELYSQLTVFENAVAGGVARARPGFIASLCGLRKIKNLHRGLEQKAQTNLDLVGLGQRTNEMAGVLPAGQQRLLAIARALGSGANWLFLDEPAAGLNETEKSHLMRVIERLSQEGISIIFVEHDMRVVGNLARRVIVLDQGKLIADGTPTDMRRNERVVSAYLGTSAAIEHLPKASRGAVASQQVLLRTREISVRYNRLRALDQVSIEIRNGEIVAIVGANGAGKSSLLKAIMRVVPLASGILELDGKDVGGRSAREMVQGGICLSPEGRELFASLTVKDNLRLGGYARINRVRQFLPDFLAGGAHQEDIEETSAEVYKLFPRLAERKDQLAGTLSGGEGQMLAIGRALMSRPRLLLLDEPSLGLAPLIVAEIFRKLVDLQTRGLTIVLVEQNARAALAISDRAYILSAGQLVAGGPASDLLSSPEVSAAYLGETRQNAKEQQLFSN